MFLGEGEIQEWNDLKTKEDIQNEKNLLEIKIQKQFSKIADLDAGVFSRSLTSLH